MKDKINNILGKIFRGNNFKDNDWVVYFGYDCIGIVIHKDKELNSDLLNLIKDELSSDYPILVNITDDGFFEVGVDISNIILDTFGSWEEYDKLYS